MKVENMTGLAELVSKAKNSDQSAWAELYKITVRQIYFVVRKIVSNDQEAEDLVQETYLTAFSNLTQLQDAEKFRAWLSMIAANKCRDYLKRKKAIVFADLQSEDGDEPDWEDDRQTWQPEVLLDEKETVRLVAEIIGNLPEDQKLCVLLYYREELSIAQIAESMGVSVGTVKSRLNYARTKIKDKVIELEKKGTKLYSLAPMPFLIWLLKAEMSSAHLPASLSAVTAATVTVNTAVNTTGSVVTAAASSAASGEAAAVTAAAATAKTSIFTALGTKITAGILAGVVTVSGGAGIIAAVVQNNRDAEDSPSFMEEIRDNEETEIVVSAEIAAAYERILASSVTEHGTLTTYYAYVDLGRDGVPELVVADGTGSLDTTTTAELFCYENGEAVFYGKTFSENDYIYIVNEEHILARHPSGTQMINHEDFYASAKFFEDTDKTYEEFKAFSDAPNTNYGYSAENFKDYNAEPGEYAKLSKFKSARVLEFKENDISPVLLRDMIDLSKAWEAFEPAEPSDWAHIFVFKENGECIYILAIKDSEMLNSYYGTYEQTGDIINITLDWRNGEFANLSYRLAAQDDGFVLIQQSDEGIFYEHLEGFTMSFTASNAKTAEDMETLAAILSDPDYEEWW